MPTVSISKQWLQECLKFECSEAEFNELCFQFGLELDDVVTEKVTVYDDNGGSEDIEEVIYKVDVPANRYDLLCMEGIVRAMHVYKGIEDTPTFKCVVPPPDKIQKLVAKPEVLEVRPFVVAAVLRDVTLSGRAFASLIDLQDKLHQNICRQRTLVAIGTHDLDTLEGPFTYEAQEPDSIKFKALKQTEEYTATELMQIFENDLKLRQYLYIIRDEPRYPIIYDKHRHVLSMPPIINAELTKVSTNTKNIFIECTATDLTKAKIVLNIIVTMFSHYCAEPFTVEAVEVTDARGTTTSMPDVKTWPLKCDVDYINACISPDFNLAATDMVSLLKKLQIESKVADDKHISVSVPPMRADILHPCDVVEDVAIAYGYPNIAKTLPKAHTIAYEQPLNKLSTDIRRVIANAGFTEVFTFALCSTDETYKMLGRKNDKSAVVVANPKTFEFQVVRNTLLSGMLKCLSSNKDHPVPMRLFEVSDVVVRDGAVELPGELEGLLENVNDVDVGASNRRRICLAYTNTSTSGFEIVHGMLDHIMMELGAKKGSYSIRPPTEPRDETFFEGRRGDIIYNDGFIGEIGMIHPNVLSAFDIRTPVTALEMDLECFLKVQ